MSQDNNSQSRRSFLRTSTAVVGGTVVAGATSASADHGKVRVTKPGRGGPLGEYELAETMHRDGKKSNGWKIRYDVPKPMSVAIRLGGPTLGPMYWPKDVFRREIPEGRGTMEMWSEKAGDELLVVKGKGEPLIYR